MSKETQFPKMYKSSSAAYRAIRQFEEKNGKKDFIMEKIEKGQFQVSIGGKTKVSFEDFKQNLTNIHFNEVEYKHFPDGVHGEGYYELKTGNRRRPNSLFKTLEDVYQTLHG
jgi:hypothetical protein